MSTCLITGFGPFGSLDANPSEWLATQSGLRFQILEVSYASVRRSIQEWRSNPPPTLVMLGVANQARKFRLEMFASNCIGEALDVHGRARPGQIDPRGPQILGSTLWNRDPQQDGVEVSFDAGTYLCNFGYYLALKRLPETRVGFLHVPPVSVMGLDQQLKIVQSVLDAFEIQRD
jgi:pyrrolidone-carboxylate peptidase